MSELPFTGPSLLTIVPPHRGVTYCSEPQSFYWFNPVEVLVSELLAGARIALPAEVLTILHLLKIGSQIMYGFFVAGAVVNFVLLFATPLVVLNRWWTLVIAIVAFISGTCINVAAAIATAISIAAKVALTAQDQLNISADIGVTMFVFMWIAAICSNLAFLLHAAMGCCCLPERKEAAAAQDSSPRAKANEKRFSKPLSSIMRRRKGGLTTSSPTTSLTPSRH